MDITKMVEIDGYALWVILIEDKEYCTWAKGYDDAVHQAHVLSDTFHKGVDYILEPSYMYDWKSQMVFFHTSLVALSAQDDSYPWAHQEGECPDKYVGQTVWEFYDDFCNEVADLVRGQQQAKYLDSQPKLF